MKEKVVIYGATSTGQRIYYQIKDSAEVIAFVDEDDRKWGGR